MAIYDLGPMLAHWVEASPEMDPGSKIRGFL